MSNIKGFKVFNSDWTCRGFQYEVGKTFKHEGNIEMCGSGFHFCQKASDCFNYYNFDSKNKVAEVLATGYVETEDNKSVTNEITIVKEIPWSELLTIVNEGKDCTGLYNIGNWNTGNCNTGDWNSGDCNTGNCNTGNCNTGDWNSGDCNTGNCNTGDWNSGDWNTGNCNTGDWNSGDWNSGDWNSCNHSTGLFNSKEEKIKIFDKPSEWTLQDWFDSDVRSILNWNFESSTWIYEDNMSDEEKEQYPSYKTTGGYLKVFEFKEACNNMWNALTDSEKQRVITEFPNFDADIFFDITGIRVNKE